MRDLILKSSLVALLLLMIAFVGALPTRSDNGAGRLQQSGEYTPPEKRGGRTAIAPLSYRSPGSKHKLLIPAEDKELEQKFVSSRATGRARKYGAYSLVEVSDQQLASLDASVLERAQVRDDLNLILLRRGQIDTAGPEPKIADGLLQPNGLPHALHLVQLFGPPTPDSFRAVEATGVKIVSYVPNNTYLVWATPAQLGRVRALHERSDVVQWEGPYHPAYKLDSRIKLDSVEQIPASIQIVDTQEARQTIAYIKSVARNVLMDEIRLYGVVHIKVLAESNRLSELARLPGVLFIEPWSKLRPLDERQDQIVAGALSQQSTSGALVSRPTTPGYLAFLNSVGFTSTFDFVVDVSDTGFDLGSSDPARMHPDFLDSAGASRIAYINDLTGDSHPEGSGILPGHDPIGHGTLSASVVGGFNNKAGDAFADDLGYQYGLGVAPFARIGISRLFDDNEQFHASFVDYVSQAYRSGARISSNSWGGGCNGVPESCNFYDANCEIFDSLARDADPYIPGNQSLTLVFSAGNDGDTSQDGVGVNSIAIPATAKNVITVGATKNFRATGPGGGPVKDACGWPSTYADNAGDIIPISSSGRTQDGRSKPDIVAPGSHIQGAATQDPASRGVCDLGREASYFPPGQSLYTSATGTSFSAPAVAGGAALAYQWFKMKQGVEPSPAMVKALLLNSASYLTGKLGSDNLPGIHQGWGIMNLGRLFESGDKILYDESPSRTFTESGGAPFEITGVISDPSKEFRVMLDWTDAPGNSATNAPYVNQLNLEVIVNGNLYNGNVFNGQYSITGGQKDFLNNTQGVRLPAGTTGTFVIRVRPTVIAGDGVPDNGLDLDQDFALVVTNGREAAVPVLALDIIGDNTQGVSILHADGITDPYILPGETAKIMIAVSNKSQTASATINSYQISITSNGRTNLQGGPASFPVIGPGESKANAEPFVLAIPSDLRCGSVAELKLVLATPNGQFNLPVRVHVGRAVLTTAALQPLLSDDVDGGRVKWKKKKGFDVSANTGHSGTQSYHVVDAGKEDENDQESTLQLKKAVSIPDNVGDVRLSFFHIFNFEPGFDGGVLEISDDGGETWQDLGSRILVGGYDGQVTSASNNPLGNRFAWTSRGRAGVFSQVVINLNDFAGKRIRLRFIAGFDLATGIREGYTGWFIDDIQITANLYSCK